MGFDGTTIHYNRRKDLEEIFSADPDKCWLSVF